MGAVDEIKARLDIFDVISQHVTLKKSGSNFKAACPFHSERTPSFYVSPERQTWHCFGACGTGGDVFSFVMRQEGIEFQEALTLLAERAGVQLSPGSRDRDDETERLFRVNDAAAGYFHHLLLGSPQAEGARRYLKRRDISQDSVEQFQLGFSPPGGDILLKHLKAQGYPSKDLTAAGLVTVFESGDLRDLFRGRLMFPIRDERGRVVGLGGRSLDNTGPKYLNSPQTAIFDKSGILYGVDRARGAIRKDKWAVVVEGYMDVLTAHQHGFYNVVASMGTALTEKQVGRLRRLATRVSMAMDADSAGQEATIRSLKSSWQTLYRNVHSVRGQRGQRFLEGPPQQTIDVVVLPTGKDPDNVIRENEQEWISLLQNAKPLLDYIMEADVSRVDLAAPGAKGGVLEEWRPLLVTADFLDQDSYVRKAADLLGVTQESIKLTLKSTQPSRPKGRSRGKVDVREEFEKVERGDAWEEYVLTLLLQQPMFKELVSELSPDVFKRPENREIFVKCMSSDGPDQLMTILPEPFLDQMEILASRDLLTDSQVELEKGLTECIRRLEERRLKDLKIQEEQFLSLEAPEDEEVNAIQRSGLGVNVKLKELHNRGQGIVN